MNTTDRGFNWQKRYLRTVLGLPDEEFGGQTLRFGYTRDGRLTYGRYAGQIATVWVRRVSGVYGKEYAAVVVMPGEELYGGSAMSDGEPAIEQHATRELGAVYAKAVSFRGMGAPDMAELLEALAGAMAVCEELRAGSSA